MWEQINEEKWETTDGIHGNYIAHRPYSDGEKVDMSVYDGRKEDIFLDALTNQASETKKGSRYRGDFAKFCWEHQIGVDFTKDERTSRKYGHPELNYSFVEWIGSDSHYDEDHFFFVTGLKGYEDKRVAFQLRVSNHIVNHKTWEGSHVHGHSRRNIGGKPINAAFSLNFIINPMGTYGNEAMVDQASTFVGSIECDISDYYRGMSAERKAMIDDFVTRLESGERGLTISYEDIKKMDISSEGPRHIAELVQAGTIPYRYKEWKENSKQKYEMYRTSGDMAPDEINFTEREPLALRPKSNRGLIKKGVLTTIPYSAIAGKHAGEMFTYDSGERDIPKYWILHADGPDNKKVVYAVAVDKIIKGVPKENNSGKKAMFVQDTKSIPLEAAIESDNNMLVYGGQLYRCDTDTYKAIPVIKAKNGADVEDFDNVVPIVESRRSRKFQLTEGDIMRMVKEVLKEITNKS